MPSEPPSSACESTFPPSRPTSLLTKSSFTVHRTVSRFSCLEDKYACQYQVRKFRSLLNGHAIKVSGGRRALTCTTGAGLGWLLAGCAPRRVHYDTSSTICLTLSQAARTHRPDERFPHLPAVTFATSLQSIDCRIIGHAPTTAAVAAE